MSCTNVHADVKNYYGQELQQSSDLKTDACCSKADIPPFIHDILRRIHPEVVARYYGCGLVFPPKLDGCRVLDLGCGAGRDVYILSSLVGSQGSVVGVDMTPEQLDIARRFVDYHTEQFGLSKPNVEFYLGQIEQLTNVVGLQADSFDVVVSNCVVNLAPDKKKVLEQVWQVLKTGGEFYFSDVYADRAIPDELRQNKVLWGECLSGALCESDLVAFALELGFTPPQRVTSSPIGVENKQLQDLIGDIKFTSCTYRMFKNKSSCCSATASDASVTYEKPMLHYEDEFRFNETTLFKLSGKPKFLNAELAHMLAISRYTENFKFAQVTAETEPSNFKEVSADDQTSACSTSGGCCGRNTC